MAKRGVAGLGWGWVCNKVCNGYVTRSVTRQSKAQQAKHASAALFNASQAAAKTGVAGPGWGWVCNKVCNGYVTRSVTRQSKAQQAKHASAALFNASQAAAKTGVAGPGWGWVCNEVCNGYVTRSVTRQSEAQYAKRAAAALLINASQAAAKSSGRWPGWGWLCNEVCNGYVTRSVTRQSKAQYAKRLRSSSLIAAIQRKPSCGKKRAVTSLAWFVRACNEGCVTRVCNEPAGFVTEVCNEVCNECPPRLCYRPLKKIHCHIRLQDTVAAESHAQVPCSQAVLELSVGHHQCKPHLFGCCLVFGHRSDYWKCRRGGSASLDVEVGEGNLGLQRHGAETLGSTHFWVTGIPCQGSEGWRSQRLTISRHRA